MFDNAPVAPTLRLVVPQRPAAAPAAIKWWHYPAALLLALAALSVGFVAGVGALVLILTL